METHAQESMEAMAGPSECVLGWEEKAGEVTISQESRSSLQGLRGLDVSLWKAFERFSQGCEVP